MAKKLLIDATHPEEIRVAVVKGQILEDFDSETSTKKQIKGNIYLAKVIRVEPSLQAAFVEFGGNRHGFLPFSEIHPDYYKLPVSDRSSLKEERGEDHTIIETELLEIETIPQEDDPPITLDESKIEDPIENELDLKDSDHTLESEDERIEDKKNNVSLKTTHYKYKIQEVIKRRHILLVQVAKEERGNKGASLTTYLSLPGRYCVLMPNSGYRAGGVSRKINDGEDRRRLKDLVKDLSTPEGMALIVRTAGQERNKTEIRRDYEYLLRLWNEIRELTLKSVAPCLVYAEGDLIKKAIRDIYDRDVEEILVEGEEAYKQAKNFMRQLIPSHARKVKLFKDDNYPLFQRFKVEERISQMMYPSVKLPSGGSIVINITEALVAVDVNSGRSTRERHIDETALKTNLEAADEIARQMRLRDLAGLIVVDFIDMNESNHIQQVEKRLREAVKVDRARTQIGKISQFGLMEMSRQRLRPSLLETYTITCNHCHGTGVVRSIESMALHVLRDIETNAIQHPIKEVLVTVPNGVDLYLLNQKRQNLITLEKRFNLSVHVNRDLSLNSPDFRLDILALHEKSNSVLPLKENEPPLTVPITVKHNHPIKAKEQSIPSQTQVQQEALSKPVAEKEEEDKGASGAPRNRRRLRRRRPPQSRNNILQENEKEEKEEGVINIEVEGAVFEKQPLVEEEAKKPTTSENVLPLKKRNRRYPRQIKSQRPSTEDNNSTKMIDLENSRKEPLVRNDREPIANPNPNQAPFPEGIQNDPKGTPVSRKRSKGWLRRLLDS